MEFVFSEKGNYDKITGYLLKLSKLQILKLLDKYGKRGVDALKSSTPTRSGLTASSWDYDVSGGNGLYSIKFNNSNINRGVNVAMILDVGHGTGTGGWVEGLDYINPALQPVFDDLLQELMREVSTL